MLLQPLVPKGAKFATSSHIRQGDATISSMAAGFLSNDIPQAGSLEGVRKVVSAVARSSARSAVDLAHATALPVRQVQYAVRAARTLGWLNEGEEGLQATPASDGWLAIPQGTPAERAFLRAVISNNPVIGRIAPGLLSDHPPSRIQLTQQIVASSNLSEATAQRRAQALLSWRHQIVRESLDPTASDNATARGDTRHIRLGLPVLDLPTAVISEALVRDIVRDNPWWQGDPGKSLPPHRRSFVNSIHKRLRNRLAPVVVVRGPRQVGKTTAQLQVITDLLSSGVSPRRILRVQFDELPEITSLQEPILRIVEWYEEKVLERSLNAAAKSGESTYLFFDEVQNLSNWAIQLKHLVDNSTTQIVVTGSSALRIDREARSAAVIEHGRDSLAGRITTLDVGTLSLCEISAIRGLGALLPLLSDNGLDSLIRKEFWHELRQHGQNQAVLRDLALQAFSERGGYPLVHERADVPWSEIAPQLNETVIQRVIQHDLRIGENKGRKRDAALLEELFRLACRYAGQTPGVDLFAREVHRALHANVGVQRVRHYLDFLDRTLLLRLVRPLEIRLKRTRGSHKLCLADHGLRASWLHELIPISPAALGQQPDLSDLAGRIVESIIGSYLLSLGGIALTHFPERKDEPEVDYVITLGTQRIPIEIKYRRRIDPLADTEGLRSFIERKVYNAPFGVLITQSDEVVIADPRIVVVSLASLLLLR